MDQHSQLSKDQLLALYSKLANDDDFRTLFATKPAKALTTLGVPADTVVNLPPEHLIPSPIAGKSAFADAHKDLLAESAQANLCMVGPHLRLDNGPQNA